MIPSNGHKVCVDINVSFLLLSRFASFLLQSVHSLSSTWVVYTQTISPITFFRYIDGAHWPHHTDHCPNLVPNDVDRELIAKNPHHEALANDNAVNVTVRYAVFDQHHESLVHFWNDWYRDYVKAPFPRLIVRFEDLIFHPKSVIKAVCECAGGEMNLQKPFKYIVDSAKKGSAHGQEGQKTSYVDALVKYGTEVGRYKGFEMPDLEYAKRNLDPELMRLFGYRLPHS